MPHVLTASDARARHIRRADMVACEVAFIDCKMPGSERKQNYSLVGPGVTQSHDQIVNLTEPHGFSLGVAAMPPGTVNNLHVHFTAEVFMVSKGAWTFRWGADPASNRWEHEIQAGPGDVVSIPTWIFRGFTNSGADDGWIFTALGGDDTGGIIWHPSILETAAHYGLYLNRDNMLVNAEGDGPAPAPDARMPALTLDQIARLPRYTPEQMRRRVVTAAERDWSAHALLSAVLPGCASELAPVIGHGMTEDRAHTAPIGNPHGFSVEWLRLPPHSRTGRHAIAEKQVAIVFRGTAAITLNEPGSAVAVEVAEGECFSAPGDVWRDIAAGQETLEIALVTAGDQRKPIRWAPDILAAAAAAGWGLDHDGRVAPLDLLPPSTRATVTERMARGTAGMSHAA